MFIGRKFKKVAKKWSKTNSFNGAKGRKLTTEEDWESTAYQIARAERSWIKQILVLMQKHKTYSL